MVATPLATLDPYIPLDVTKFYFVPSISSIAAPTRAELDAGTDLSPQVVESSGWSVSGSTVESQSLVGAALKLPGATTLDDSSLTMRNSRTSTDARTILTHGLSCFIVKFPEGDVAGYKMNVFQVIVNAEPGSAGITDPSTTEFQFAMIDYKLRVAVPA